MFSVLHVSLIMSTVNNVKLANFKICGNKKYIHLDTTDTFSVKTWRGI